MKRHLCTLSRRRSWAAKQQSVCVSSKGLKNCWYGQKDSQALSLAPQPSRGAGRAQEVSSLSRGEGSFSAVCVCEAGRLRMDVAIPCPILQGDLWGPLSSGTFPSSRRRRLCPSRTQAPGGRFPAEQQDRCPVYEGGQEFSPRRGALPESARPGAAHREHVSRRRRGNNRSGWCRERP